MKGFSINGSSHVWDGCLLGFTTSSGAPILATDIRSATARAAYKLQCCRQWVGKRIGHATIQREMLRGKKFVFPQDWINKSLQFGNRFRTKILSREVWENPDHIPGHGDIWCTDGSKSEEGTDFGICEPKRRKDKSYCWREYNPVFQGEMAAIDMCATSSVRKRNNQIIYKKIFWEHLKRVFLLFFKYFL